MVPTNEQPYRRASTAGGTSEGFLRMDKRTRFTASSTRGAIDGTMVKSPARLTYPIPTVGNDTRQLGLFDRTPAPTNHDGLTLPPHQAHSATSRWAAESIYPKQGTLRRQVLDYITCQGGHGATDEEIQDALAMTGNTERPRRVELTGYKDLPVLVKDSGLKRRTRSGEWAVVWVSIRNKEPL